MDTKFIRDRITQLRIQKGVSQYKMSYALGHSRSYIYNISFPKSLPPMAEFLEICDIIEQMKAAESVTESMKQNNLTSAKIV